MFIFKNPFLDKAGKNDCQLYYINQIKSVILYKSAFPLELNFELKIEVFPENKLSRISDQDFSPE